MIGFLKFQTPALNFLARYWHTGSWPKRWITAKKMDHSQKDGSRPKRWIMVKKMDHGQKDGSWPKIWIMDSLPVDNVKWQNQKLEM